MEPLLKVNDLRTRFSTPEGTVFAVNGISFQLEEGQTLAVVGESGRSSA
jgi:ABC-type dipeptide/oligopeptide/nickel transport system ATPase component